MSDYISREAFKAEIRRLSTHYLNEWDTLGVLAAADRIPAADVAPVRHGRWSFKGEWLGWICSECEGNYSQISNFCPNCGSMMRERERTT